MKNALSISALTMALGLAVTLPAYAMGGAGGTILDPARFDSIDTNKDGKLSKSEIEADRATRFAEADADKDGKLSSAELKAHHAAHAGERAEKRMAKMLNHMDKDGDGALTLAEMSGNKRGEKMFSRIDTDADGALSKAELQAAREHMKKHHKDGHGSMDE